MDEKMIYVAKDDSMIGDRIVTGDTLLIDPIVTVGNTSEEIYLMEVDGERRLGRIEHQGERHRVYVSNSNCPDSFYKTVSIIGRVFSNVLRF
ncbi:S24 family peptidase [Paenibacillus sp. FSL F4-0087]|uniref:S24 family peptidase n=1 Tax=Paenibacillus sp. FSL F4-0087 TaxID=2921368 RepID=UPI00096FE379|nr:hypothetical protein BK122_15615 [Paenibacillus pabuli]